MHDARDTGRTRAIPETSRRRMLAGGAAALVAGAAIATEAKGAEPAETAASRRRCRRGTGSCRQKRIMALDGIFQRLAWVEDQMKDAADADQFATETVTTDRTGQNARNARI